MQGYVPNTAQQQLDMLEEIGGACNEELFAGIPAGVRLGRRLDLPGGLPEMELLRHMRELSSKNGSLEEYTCFLGAGAYDHYIPSGVDHILSRQEFYTSYTPYQPEISQGTLQAIFEYQTMICELTGMKAANASMYDGATALAEAVKMACRHTGRHHVVVGRNIHPEYRTVLNTYGVHSGFLIETAGWHEGQLDLADLEARITQDTSAVVVQSPNFFGIVEDIGAIAGIAHARGALLIVSADPISLALLKPPAECGADIVTGEGQPLGTPVCFGGPYLGYFATSAELIRKMPGRIAGETVDREGKRCFVLTIQAREQHIRREKATSNICTNEALNALAAAVYLTAMGRNGLRKVAVHCAQKSHYTFSRLLETGKFKAVFNAPFFKEFAVSAGIPVSELNRKLLGYKIIGGYELGRTYPELPDGWLIAVTEKRTKREIDLMVEKVGGSV